MNWGFHGFPLLQAAEAPVGGQGGGGAAAGALNAPMAYGAELHDKSKE